MFRAAGLAGAALDAFIGVNGMRLSEFAGYRSNRAVAGALCASYAELGIDNEMRKLPAGACAALLVVYMLSVLLLKVLQSGENRIRSSFSKSAK